MGANIRKILATVLIMVLSYLLIANISHMVTIRKTYSSSIDKEHTTVKILHKNYEVLSQNIATLKGMTKTNHLSEEDFNTIVKSLEDGKKAIDNSKFMNLDFNKNYNDVTLMDMLYRSGEIKNLNMIQSYDTVIKQDATCGFDRDEITNTYVRIMFSLGNVQNSLMDNYQYHTKDQGFVTAIGTEVMTIITNTSDKIKLMTDLSSYLVKDGVLYE